MAVRAAKGERPVSCAAVSGVKRGTPGRRSGVGNVMGRSLHPSASAANTRAIGQGEQDIYGWIHGLSPPARPPTDGKTTPRKVDYPG